MGAPICNFCALKGTPVLVYALLKIYEIFFMIVFLLFIGGSRGDKGTEAPPPIFFQIRFLIDDSRHRNVHCGDFFV